MTRKLFSVASVHQYQHPYASVANVMDVYLTAEDGSKATLVGVPAIAHENEADRRTLLEAFKLQKFEIGLAGELPLVAKPKRKRKPAPKRKR